MAGLSIGNRFTPFPGFSAGGGLSRGSGLSFGGFMPSPVLSLIFAGATTLDSLITFSRPSLGMLFDSTGKYTYCPNNLLTYNTDPNSWTKSGVASVVGQVVTFTGAGAFQQIANSGWGGTAIVGQKFVFGVTLSGSGTITLDGNGCTGTNTVTLSSTPTYYVVNLTAAATSSIAARIISYVGDTATSFTMHNAYFSAVTYETTTRPSDFVNTTASAYYGPRFDYNPSTLAARGLLIEEARTNLITYSSQFDNVAWGKDVGITVTAETDVAPDGTTTADTIASSGTSGTLNAYQSITVSSGTAYTYSVFLKKTSGATRYAAVQIYEASYSPAVINTNTGVISSNGATQTATISDAGNYWRVAVTRTVAVTTVYPVVIPSWNSDGSQTASAGAGSVVAWGAQLEANSSAASYIPTGSSSVARSADVATMTGTNFSSWYNQSEGTFFFQFDSTNLVSDSTIFCVDDGTIGQANQIDVRSTGSVTTRCRVRSGGASTVDLNTGTVGVGAAVKVAFAVKANNSAAVANVNALQPGPASAAMPATTMSQLVFGRRGTTGVTMIGHWISLQYYNTRLTNAQLQAMTA